MTHADPGPLELAEVEDDVDRALSGRPAVAALRARVADAPRLGLPAGDQ